MTTISIFIVGIDNHAVAQLSSNLTSTTGNNSSDNYYDKPWRAVLAAEYKQSIYLLIESFILI